MSASMISSRLHRPVWSWNLTFSSQTLPSPAPMPRNCFGPMCGALKKQGVDTDIGRSKSGARPEVCRWPGPVRLQKPAVPPHRHCSVVSHDDRSTWQVTQRRTSSSYSWTSVIRPSVDGDQRGTFGAGFPDMSALDIAGKNNPWVLERQSRAYGYGPRPSNHSLLILNHPEYTARTLRVLPGR